MLSQENVGKTGTVEGPAEEGLAEEGPVEEGPAEEGPAEEGPAEEGLAVVVVGQSTDCNARCADGMCCGRQPGGWPFDVGAASLRIVEVKGS
jgi:hypothetical protein